MQNDANTGLHHHSDNVPLTDPVCGMAISSETPHRLTYEGKEVLFCSAGCKAKFAADPAKYEKSKHAASSQNLHDHAGHVSDNAPSAASPGVKWTCPMHPQI